MEPVSQGPEVSSSEKELLWYEKDITEQSPRTLYRKMRKTAMARFNCALRLSYQHKVLQWCLPLLSAILLIVSLQSQYAIVSNVSEQKFAFLQVSLTILLLIISILATSRDKMADSEKMHRCGLEINELAKKILPMCNDGRSNEVELQKYQDEYSYLLKAYDNHSPIDFRKVKCELTDEYSSLSWWDHAWTHITYWLSILWVIILAIGFSIALCVFTFWSK